MEVDFFPRYVHYPNWRHVLPCWRLNLPPKYQLRLSIVVVIPAFRLKIYSSEEKPELLFLYYVNVYLLLYHWVYPTKVEARSGGTHRRYLLLVVVGLIVVDG